MERNERQYNLFLIGFMGAGKSTIAARLCRMLQMERMEMDQEIEKREGMPIPEIFAVHGEAYFRGLETSLLKELETERGLVVSCGGGAAMRGENVEYMKKSGPVVWLTASPETVYERVRHGQDRPVLNGHMNVDYIRGLMEQREPFYRAAADIMVATDGKDRETICREIAARPEISLLYERNKG